MGASENSSAKKFLEGGTQNQLPAEGLAELLRICFEPLKEAAHLRVNARAIKRALECMLVTSTVV
jgi:hypothetical protein